MSSIQNTAAWLPAVGKKLELGPSEIPVPGDNELLIEVSDDQGPSIFTISD